VCFAPSATTLHFRAATAFDVTLTSLEGEPRRFRPNRTFDDLRRNIGQIIQDAERDQQNVILRPRWKTAALIHLDDLASDPAHMIQLRPS